MSAAAARLPTFCCMCALRKGQIFLNGGTGRGVRPYKEMVWASPSFKQRQNKSKPNMRLLSNNIYFLLCSLFISIAPALLLLYLRQNYILTLESHFLTSVNWAGNCIFLFCPLLLACLIFQCCQALFVSISKKCIIGPIITYWARQHPRGLCTFLAPTHTHEHTHLYLPGEPNLRQC